MLSVLCSKSPRNRRGFGEPHECDDECRNHQIERERPRIVIVNTKLIDGDGLEWLARLRTEHSAADLPALVFSLDPSLETVERAFHAGTQDYLITPFDPTVLEDKIHKLLQAPDVPSKRFAFQLF